MFLGYCIVMSGDMNVVDSQWLLILLVMTGHEGLFGTNLTRHFGCKLEPELCTNYLRGRKISARKTDSLLLLE